MPNPSIRIALAAAAATLLAGCGDNAQEVEVEQQLGEDLAATTPTFDEGTSATSFIDVVGEANMYLIEASRIALDKAENDQVREFARTIQDDHERAASNLEAAISQTDLLVSPPAVVSEHHREMLETLRSISPEDFDPTYVNLQLNVSRNTLNQLQRYAAGGDQQALQAFAADAIAVVQSHLDRAEQLDDVVGDSVISPDDATMDDDARVGDSSGAY